MFIVLFTFIGTTLYVLKHGIGKEKLLFLYPLGIFLLINFAFAVAVAVSPSIQGTVELILGLPTTVLLVASCIWIVKKVRSNSMARVIAALENGTFKAPGKKLEL